jgi:thiamine phosphate synthase YjbQ (UPF0047 family)
MQEGLSLCSSMHITSSVFINDDERGLHEDYDDWLEELASHEPANKYRHNRTGESLPWTKGAGIMPMRI